MPINDVVAYVGTYTNTTTSSPGSFPESAPAGYAPRLLDTYWRPGDYSDATRELGTIDAGDCVNVWWMVWYGPDAAGGTVISLDMWATSSAGLAVLPQRAALTIRRSISASANKIVTANAPPGWTLNPGPQYFQGEKVALCYTSPGFGVIGSGDSNNNGFWIQPVGDPAFDPDVLRLVGTMAILTSTKCTGGYTYNDRVYFEQIDSGDWDQDGTV